MPDVGVACFHGVMSFVHGHARESTWVVSHLRAPNRAEDGQLELEVEEPEPAIPRPRESVEDLSADVRSANSA